MLRTCIPSLLVALATFGAIPGSTSTVSAQPRCEAPQVMVVIDRSSSMSGSRGGMLPSGQSKWQAAHMAVGELTSSFAEDVDFGIAVYPAVDGRNSCDPGDITLGIGTHTAEQLLAAVPAEDPPHGGNWTPTSQILDVVREYAPMADPARDNHVILITDGQQCCITTGGVCISSQRFWPVESVMSLAELGMTVHVVGFGALTDALTLNRAALAGGTALPGCDPDGEDAASPDNCYAQANDLTELRTALDAIARDITDEVCDGFDNDCDGVVDDGFDADGDGISTCAGDCVDTDPAIGSGLTEICDGLDNDCDGTADPGCACTFGETQPCGSEIGMCAAGTQSCTATGWGACTGAIDPVLETCDGGDEDCDGTIDEDALCGRGYLCDVTAGACIPAAPTDGGCCSVAAGAETADGRAGALGLALGLLALVWIRRRR